MFLTFVISKTKWHAFMMRKEFWMAHVTAEHRGLDLLRYESSLKHAFANVEINLAYINWHPTF